MPADTLRRGPAQVTHISLDTVLSGTATRGALRPYRIIRKKVVYLTANLQHGRVRIAIIMQSVWIDLDRFGKDLVPHAIMEGMGNSLFQAWGKGR